MFQLFFDSETLPQLIRTKFISNCSGSAVHSCVRGRSSGAYEGYGVFQWTSAVRALAVLAVQSTIAAKLDDVQGWIEGEASSLASSLDYAIDKEPLWLMDMFGVDALGRMKAKRIFRRSNSGRKRGGPVAISVNSTVLPIESITIHRDGCLVQEPHQLWALQQLISARVASDCLGAARVDNISRPLLHQTLASSNETLRIMD